MDKNDWTLLDSIQVVNTDYNILDLMCTVCHTVLKVRLPDDRNVTAGFLLRCILKHKKEDCKRLQQLPSNAAVCQIIYPEGVHNV